MSAPNDIIVIGRDASVRVGRDLMGRIGLRAGRYRLMHAEQDVLDLLALAQPRQNFRLGEYGAGRADADGPLGFQR